MERIYLAYWSNEAMNEQKVDIVLPGALRHVCCHCLCYRHATNCAVKLLQFHVHWFREIFCHNNQCADFSKFDRLWPTRVMGNVAVIKTVCITRDMSPVALQLIVAGRLCWDEEQTSLSMKF